MKDSQYITHSQNSELASKYSSIKKDILIEIEIIKNRIQEEENAGQTWAKLANLNKVLADLKEITEFLKPF